MDWKKLIVNALLAGFWAGLATLEVSGELSKAALWAAGTIAVRTAIGYVADAVNHPVSVDR